jgi:hypothetical protein
MKENVEYIEDSEGDLWKKKSYYDEITHTTYFGDSVNISELLRDIQKAQRHYDIAYGKRGDE